MKGNDPILAEPVQGIVGKVDSTCAAKVLTFAMVYVFLPRDYILWAIAAYLIGSVPFGYILVRLFKKQDIRETGSGNIGATNVARTAPALGIATLALDALKGFIAVWLVWTFGFPSDDRTLGMQAAVIFTAGVFVILGHMFPVWLRFHGGKGVATAVGVFLALSPKAVLLSMLVFLLVFVLSRYVSLSSMVAAASFPVFAYIVRRSDPLHTKPLLVASIVIAILIIGKHHENIRRIIAGSENKFGKKKVEAVTAED